MENIIEIEWNIDFDQKTFSTRNVWGPEKGYAPS